MSEDQAEYITDAKEMTGKGYEHPAVTIEPPHAVMERRGNEFKEVITPAFVKISTDFKTEMAKIDEIALKVWLFIALSVNRYSGKANPGLRAIAAGTGFAINTVQAALKRLENDYNLLTVDRESRKYNIYEPLAFVSANKATPISAVSPDDTPKESVSDNGQSVSDESESVSVLGQSVSPRMILNQSNQSLNQIKPELLQREKTSLKNSIASKGGIDWLIAGGASEEEVSALLDKEKQVKVITEAYERAMGYNCLPWGKLERLQRFLMTKTVEEIQAFATWSRREYSTFTPAKARQYPDMVIDLWPQAFLPVQPARNSQAELLRQLRDA